MSHTHTTCPRTTCSHTTYTLLHTQPHTPLVHPQLVHAQLTHTQLAHTQLVHAQLAHTQLVHTQLTHTQRVHTRLTHTQLTHTQLAHTQITHAQLAHTTCSHTTCPGTTCRQAWHLVTSTFPLRGRRGPWRHGRAFCVAGAAVIKLGWSPRLFAWQAWHLATSTFTLRGRREPWRHRPSLCVAGKALGDIELGWCLTTPSCTLRGRRGTYGTGLALVARLGSFCSSQLFAWQAWHLATSTCILCGRRGPWRHRHAVCMACVALMALGWLWWRLGPLVAAAVCVAYTWLLTTSTFTLRGRHGTFGTGLALVARLGPLVAAAVCVPYVTLDDIDLHFAWQAWHLATSTCILHCRRGTWRHRHAFCVPGVALMTLGWLWWRLPWVLWSAWQASLCVVGVAIGDIDLHFAWQAWHLWHWAGSGRVPGSFGRRGCLRGRHGTWRHRPSLCVAGLWRHRADVALDVAGVALMAQGWLWWRAWVVCLSRVFAWQAWHLTTSTCILRGRCGPWRHRPSLCAAGVALGDIENNTFTRNPFAHLTWICISCTHRSSTISCLFPALPIPSSPFFGYLLEEVDMWGYPVL